MARAGWLRERRQVQGGVDMTTKKGKAIAPAPKLTPPSSAEAASIAAAKQRNSARSPRTSITIAKQKPGETPDFSAPHDDRAGFLERLQDAFGTRGMAFVSTELNHLVQASSLGDGTTDGTRLNALLAVVDGCRPANEVETMLASQIAVTHQLAMDLMRRMRRAEHLPQFEGNGRMAVKMLNAFTAQVELLNRIKRGPAQTVRVEHVHVQAGAQAIVGNVAPAALGGGEKENVGSQPHAKGQITAAGAPFVPQVRGEDARREPVPVACGDGQGALPDARRREG